MNKPAALTYINGISNTAQRQYALRLFNYYRDYGTQQPSPWPHQQGASLPSSTVTRINNRIRHFMIGDCDPNGNTI